MNQETERQNYGENSQVDRYIEQYGIFPHRLEQFVREAKTDRKWNALGKYLWWKSGDVIKTRDQAFEYLRQYKRWLSLDPESDSLADLEANAELGGRDYSILGVEEYQLDKRDLHEFVARGIKDKLSKGDVFMGSDIFYREAIESYLEREEVEAVKHFRSEGRNFQHVIENAENEKVSVVVPQSSYPKIMEEIKIKETYGLDQDYEEFVREKIDGLELKRNWSASKAIGGFILGSLSTYWGYKEVSLEGIDYLSTYEGAGVALFTTICFGLALNSICDFIEESSEIEDLKYRDRQMQIF
ncbi:MAG: hypothetical protein SVV03_04100 [Candidatus Nanohaloarchaea archaeon]|nr:hypothetical protein [Candidatus Nanohaloarchaea archaeon]